VIYVLEMIPSPGDGFDLVTRRDSVWIESIDLRDPLATYTQTEVLTWFTHDVLLEFNVREPHNACTNAARGR
jgi:hypothetical protein